MSQTGPVIIEARQRHLRRAVALEAATVLWNVIEGVVAVAAGTLSGSVALIGFGIDSFIETTSAAVVGRRFLSELRGTGRQGDESRATRVAGTLLLVLASYITLDAGRRLLGYGAAAEESRVGMVLCPAQPSGPTLSRPSPAPGCR